MHFTVPPALAAATALLLSSCGSFGPVTPSRATDRAVAAAEAFVLRHGLTAAGHPENLPVQRIEYMEGLGSESDADLVKKRLNWVRPHAFAVDKQGNDWFVLFKTTSGDDCTVAIVVSRGEAWKQMDACYVYPSKNVLVLPQSQLVK